MSQLKQFVQDAIRTESIIDTVKVNETLLSETLAILIAAGTILDQIKKHAFYGKPYDVGAISVHISSIMDATTIISKLDSDQVSNDETDIPINSRLFHAIVGIATESTELLEALDTKGKAIDHINIAEELGDLDWYKAICVDELNISWETILDTVINKLKARYPDKFTSEAAINRDVQKERQVLDEME